MIKVTIFCLSFPHLLIHTYFSGETENTFFEILLPNSKAITVVTIYRFLSQTNVLKVLNNNMNKINPEDSFNMNLFLIGYHILVKYLE